MGIKMKQRKDVRVFLSRFLLSILIIIFCVSLFQFLKLYQTQKGEKDQFVPLQAQVSDAREESAEGKTAVKKTRWEIYDELYRQNPDFYGWIYVEGTRIDYPVMYTPGDVEYYLHRSFEKEYSYSGVPFLGEGCRENGNNLLVYGHHMRNGTMFADLTKYQDTEFRKQHQDIIFDTRTYTATYQVVAAFPTKILPEEGEGFRYYEYAGKLGKERFHQYVAGIRSLSGQSMEGVEYGDRLLTLSTCAYHTQDGRFVVVAKEIQRDER